MFENKQQVLYAPSFFYWTGLKVLRMKNISKSVAEVGEDQF